MVNYLVTVGGILHIENVNILKVSKIKQTSLPYNADIKHLTPVVVFPGLVLNTHKSFIDYCIWLKDSFVISKITIYIHTWEFQENIEALDRLLDLLSKYDDFEVKVITEKYNSPNFINFLYTIDPIHYKEHVLIKRVLIWYSFMRALEEVNKDHKEAYVFKIRSGILFEHFKELDFNKVTRLHYDQLTEFISPLNIKRANLRSVLFTKYTFSEGIDEILLNSSLGYFRDILGNSVDELAFKLKSMYAKYRRLYDNSYTPGLISDKRAPFGGPQILRELIDQFDPLSISVQSEMYRGCTQILQLKDSKNQLISYPAPSLTDNLDYKFFPEQYFPQATNIENLI